MFCFLVSTTIQSQEPRSKSLARCKNKFLMTTFQETTNNHKLIIFCFSVDSKDNQLLKKLKAGTRMMVGPKSKMKKSKIEGKLSKFTIN